MGVSDQTSLQALLAQLKDKGIALDEPLLGSIGRLAAGLQFDPDALNTATDTGTALTSEQAAVVPDIDFTVNEWGLVLILREPAVKYLQGGGTITAAMLSAAASAAGVVIPVAGVAISVLCGLLAAVVAAYLGAVTMIDQGKGVYLTESWGQIVAAILWAMFAPLILIPVIGPIQ